MRTTYSSKVEFYWLRSRPVDGILVLDSFDQRPTPALPQLDILVGINDVHPIVNSSQADGHCPSNLSESLI